MNRQEIKDFIYLASGQHIHFYFVDAYKGTYSHTNFAAGIVKSKHRGGKHIIIDRNNWFSATNESQKYQLLHEIGHIKDPNHSWHKGAASGELFAQTWAIKRARKLGMPEIARKCINGLKKWKLCKWNEYRPHVLAYRLAKQKGLI